MLGVSAVPLSDDTLLARYRGGRNYTDCWITDVAAPVTHAQFIEAFYTTWVFCTERFILKWLVDKPSTAEDARRLARSEADDFAAWFVEARAPDQMLLSDFRKRTRSWLMVEPREDGTRLFFGSAVVAVADTTTGRPVLGAAVHALMGVHKLYSVVLLAAARRRLNSNRIRRDQH